MELIAIMEICRFISVFENISEIAYEPRKSIDFPFALSNCLSIKPFQPRN